MDGVKSAFFCGMCGAILTAYGKHEQMYDVVCSCGHVNQLHKKLEAGEKAPRQETKGSGIATQLKSAGFPHTCKKCGFGFCEPTQLNPSYSDESDILLFKCKKCGFVERQADGTGNT